MTDVLSTTLSISVIAVAVSMVIAVVIRGIVAALGRLEAKPAARSATTVLPQQVAPDGPPPEHVAAIAAALAAVLGGHRIVHIEEGRRHTGWLAEGRQAHHGSHGVEHHPRH
ncbi:MAG TPA: hypothetical protein PK375_12280 [Rhodocyclaceae bacterium]|nr:hypothetical protein [Rhodocyclaceae bacterium]HNH36690.1 hypothetical protein [Rhodocyclaceae bacterium]